MIYIIFQEDRGAELHLTEVLDMLLTAALQCQILMSREIDNDMKRRYLNSCTLDSSLRKCNHDKQGYKDGHSFSN